MACSMCEITSKCQSKIVNINKNPYNAHDLICTWAGVKITFCY
jgi:hypothetical protein